MKHGSFTRKLILSYLVLAVIPLLVLLVIVMVNTTKSTEKTSQSKLDSAAALAAAQFHSLKDTMEFISLDVICKEDFIQMAKGLTYSDNTTYEEQQYYQGVAAALCTYSNVVSNYNLVYFNEKGHFITSEKYNNQYTFQFRLEEGEISRLDWKEEADQNSGATILLPLSKTAVPEFDMEALTLVRAVRDPGKVVGYLAVQIRLEDLDYIFGIDELSDSEILVQSGTRVIYATEGFPEEEFLQGGESSLSQEYLVASASNEESDITVLLVSPMSLVFEKVMNTILTFLLEGVLLLALTIGGILVFSRQLSMPLVALKREMEVTTLENLNTVTSRKPFERYEETRYLHEEFMRMRKRLDTMIQNEITLKTLHVRELMHSLQGQINPHFLYNTMNIIGIMGLEKGDDRVYSACLKLSGLLRYFISDRNSMTTTIREEMENTKIYLDLMKLRFEDRIFFEIDCEDWILEQPVLRLMMQPFVENIFEHAFDIQHLSIVIRITGREENGRWIISIEDDGAGVKPEILAGLQETVRRAWENTMKGGSEARDGIGVVNTLLRLKLFYNGEFDYSLENKPAGGFRVVLSAEMKEVKNERN